MKFPVPTGVIYGKDVQTLFKHAQENNYAIPAVNVVWTNSINAVLEAAAAVQSPVIIQFSNGGAQFVAGKSLDNSSQQASIIGAVAGAKYIHEVAKSYNIPVIIHTDHCAKKIIWRMDGLLQANKDYYAIHSRPLFSSHMLDLSEESLEENIDISVQYFKELSAMQIYLEIELGVTGGEEDGVDNTGIDNAKLYTQPEDVAYAYRRLSEVSDYFTIAAAFGNVHGVYKPGNVQLTPVILKNCQDYIKEEISWYDKTVQFVFHGGSWSSREEIREAISYGVVKMNIDTDTQWAARSGILEFYKEHADYLQSQLGNPTWSDAPNKKYYDPRVRLRKSEQSIVARLKVAFEDLNCC
jgi:fructose-bisphosphate aldolase, class II